MYRIILIIIMVLAIGLGLILGTLNSETVTADLLWVQLQWPLGLLLLSAVGGGLVLGLVLAWLFGIIPIRAQMRRLQKAAAEFPQGSSNGNHV